MNVGDAFMHRGRRWIVTRAEPSGLLVIESELGERRTTTQEALAREVSR